MNDAFENFTQDYINLDTANYIEAVTPFTDAEYQARLRGIVSPIRLPYNQIVRKHLVAYVTTHRALTRRMLGQSQYYFPLVERELEKARAAARAQIPSRYRIGIATHRNLAFRSGRPLAVHAQYRPPVRFGNFIDDRSTARSGCLHPGRLRLPERPVQNIRGLDPGHRLLQLWSGKCEQSA